MYYIRNSKNKIVFYLKCVQFLLISFKHCNKHFTALFLQYMRMIAHSSKPIMSLRANTMVWICKILLSLVWIQMSVEVCSDSDNGLRVATISVMTALAGPRNLCHRLLGCNKTWATSNK